MCGALTKNSFSLTHLLFSTKIYFSIAKNKQKSSSQSAVRSSMAIEHYLKCSHTHTHQPYVVYTLVDIVWYVVCLCSKWKQNEQMLLLLFFSTFDSSVNLPHNMISMTNKRKKNRNEKRKSVFAVTVRNPTQRPMSVKFNSQCLVKFVVEWIHVGAHLPPFVGPSYPYRAIYCVLFAARSSSPSP